LNTRTAAGEHVLAGREPWQWRRERVELELAGGGVYCLAAVVAPLPVADPIRDPRRADERVDTLNG
jgi:hypothetical protein